jgi:hypothetical protein
VIEIKSFAAACMIVAAGYELQRVRVGTDGVASWYFDEGARPVAMLFQQVKSQLRAAETRARQ